MHTIIFSLGSNMGDRESHILYAIKEMHERIGEIVLKSSNYISEAWGKTEQSDFINAIIVLESKLSPEDCLKEIQKIENERERVRKEHWAERTLDIDILFYNQKIMQTESLTIPHPYISARLFVLIPLLEIMPDFIHPVKKISIRQLVNNCIDTSIITKQDDIV